MSRLHDYLTGKVKAEQRKKDIDKTKKISNLVLATIEEREQ